MVYRLALAALLLLAAPARAQVAPVFTFHMPQQGGYGGTVRAADGLLFVQTPFPHTIYALDLAGHVRWSRIPDADPMALGQDCCGTVQDGPTLDAGRLYLNTFDGHTLALDAPTGAVLWDVRTADPAKGETLIEPPLPAGPALIVGSAGDDFAARGWVEALDPATGRTLWRRFNTGPDADVGIQRGDDLGVATWPPQAWQQGGGSTRGLVFDQADNLLIHATGHPAPWNPEQRDGDNRWTSGLFARDPATGAVRWFAPISPHDRYAFGASPSTIPTDLGLLHPDGNGDLYVLDPATGQTRSAQPFVPVNTLTGPLQPDPAKDLHHNRTTRDICPGWPGATGPGRAAYAAGLLYIPANLLCMDMEARTANAIPGTAFMGSALRMKPGVGGKRGALIAWDVAAGKPRWTHDEPYPVVGGVAVADGLVLYGTLDGWLRGLDAQTGALRWQYQADTGIIGAPTIFAAPDGRRYVAILSGLGGVGRVAWPEIDLRDATADHGYANVLRDLPEQETPGGTLIVLPLP